MTAKMTTAIICLLVVFVGFSQYNIRGQDTCYSLQPSELSSLPSELGYFFLTRDIAPNNPDFNTLQMNYVDSTGVFPINLRFSASELVSINPTGEYFVVFDGQGDAFYQSPGSFSYFWETVADARVISIPNLMMTQLDFLDDANLTDIMLHVHWINDNAFNLLQITDDDIATIYVDVNNNEISTRTLDLPNLQLTYSEGRIYISPNGEYVFYTSAISNEYPYPDIIQSWAIAGEDGIILEENIALYSRTVAWLPDSSGLIFTTVDHTPTRIDLSGNLTTVPYEAPQHYILQTVITNDMSISANVISRPIDLEALMFVDWGEGTIKETCQDYIGVDIRSISIDGRFLPIVVADGEFVALHFVDIRTDELLMGVNYPSSTQVIPLGWGIRPPVD